MGESWKPILPAPGCARRKTMPPQAHVGRFWQTTFSVYQSVLSVVMFLFAVLLLVGRLLRDAGRSIRSSVWRSSVTRASAPPQRVVVVGGGFSGALTAQLLEADFEVTLVDNKNYFEFTPSVLRALAEPSKAAVITKPHLHYLKRADFVRESVTHIQPHLVELSNGDRLPYDYLLLATGASYYMPGKSRDQMDMEWQTSAHFVQEKDQCLMISTRIPSLSQYHARVARARRVLMIGAGTVGVELAAEIAETFPNVAVTMVGPLLARCSERCRLYCQNWLERYGVQLLQTSKVTQQDGCKFYTSTGDVIDADVAFLCTGNVPNTEVLRRSGRFGESLTDRGFARATSTLQLDGWDNVFVAGDVMHVAGESEKLCQNAIDEAHMVAANIYRASSNQPLKHYSPASKPMLISLGKYDCVFVFKSITVCGFLPALMKEFVEYFQMSSFHAATWAASMARRRAVARADPHIV